MEALKSHIKKRCVSCWKSIPYSEMRYMVRGNYGEKCNVRATERALLNQKESAKRMKDGIDIQAS